MDAATYGQLVEHGTYAGRYTLGMDAAADVTSIVVYDGLLGHHTVSTVFGVAQVDTMAEIRDHVQHWTNRWQEFHEAGAILHGTD